MDERNERIVEVEREPVVERNTTVVTSGGGGGGGGMVIAAVVLLLVGLVVLYLLFFQGAREVAKDMDLDVKIETPNVDLPKVDPPAKPSN
ncbi:hypothetical protein [Allosphingosinicella sp.]|jgi:hypothetical protein|uniref:hypothetical protein n=1 Tax=Allosphingosinicella sp. TaxID=2823234 RepID=UPI002EF807FF